MKIIQSPSLERTLRKLPKSQKRVLDSHIKKIIANPKFAKEKKGDLIGIYIYKFRINNVQYLLSYRFSSNLLELIRACPRNRLFLV